VFDFVSEYWNFIKQYFTGYSSIRRVFKQVGRSISSDYQIKQLKQFQKVNQNQLVSAKRAVEQAIESGEANVRWMRDNYQDVWDWLKEYNSKTRY